jgi:hypothetical protein
MAQENQSQHDMFVIRRLQILAQLVGGQKQIGLEAAIGAVSVLSLATLMAPVNFGKRGELNFDLTPGRTATAFDDGQFGRSTSLTQQYQKDSPKPEFFSKLLEVKCLAMPPNLKTGKKLKCLRFICQHATNPDLGSGTVA